MSPTGSGWLACDEEPLESTLGFRMPAWVISLILHAALLVILATIWTTQPENQITLTVSAEIDPQLDDEVVQQFRFSNSFDPRIGSPSVAGIEVPLSRAPVTDTTAELQTDDRPVEIAALNAPVAIQIATASQFSPNVMIRGTAGASAIGAVGAVDRITQEILLSLEQRQTLVVWIFDQSGSMQTQRAKINERFSRIYEELGVSHLVAGKKREQPLLTAVMSFGKEVHFLTPTPTDDLAQIQSSVAAIENDPSGVELTFTAIGMAVQKYQSFRVQGHRNVMLVMFSDEVGDDEDRLDAALVLCRRNAIPVYVVGVPAPFGRRDIEIKYVDPDPKFDQGVRWIPVRQGPETFFPEGVQLGFTGHTDRLDDLYRLDSGFGPFSLTRLCYETGGIYFAVHANKTEQGGYSGGAETPVMSARLNYFFDTAVMRNYLPDYLPAQEYQQMVLANKARAALVQAAQMSMVMPMNKPQLVFPKGDDEASMKRLLDEAQKAAAILQPRLDALYSVLKLGEPDRPRLTQARWQAGYDLAMGRVMAVKARTEAYNGMLAKAKTGIRFKDPKSNTFVLKPADEISVGSQLEKMANQARVYLERVVKEHPGTPWALLAATELKEPIGWRWDESYVPRATQTPRTTPPAAAGNGNPTPRPPNTSPPPKPVRENIKL
jgi:hypothetical protein